MKKLAMIKRSTDRHWVGDGFPVRSIFSYNSSLAEDSAGASTAAVPVASPRSSRADGRSPGDGGADALPGHGGEGQGGFA